MTSTTEPKVEAEPIAAPTKSITVRLKDELAKPGLVVTVTPVFAGHYRANWYRYEGFSASVVASQFLRVEDKDGRLLISDQTK